MRASSRPRVPSHARHASQEIQEIDIHRDQQRQGGEITLTGCLNEVTGQSERQAHPGTDV